MLLKKKRASTTDLSNNGDDQNLPDDDMGKFLKFFFKIFFHFGLWNFKFDGQNYLVSRDDAICCHSLHTHSVVSS